MSQQSITIIYEAPDALCGVGMPGCQLSGALPPVALVRRSLVSTWVMGGGDNAAPDGWSSMVMPVSGSPGDTMNISVCTNCMSALQAVVSSSRG